MSLLLLLVFLTVAAALECPFLGDQSFYECRQKNINYCKRTYDNEGIEDYIGCDNVGMCKKVIEVYVLGAIRHK